MKKKEQVKNIPFRQFIEKYNFCEFEDNYSNKEDTQIIRISLCDVFNEYDTLNWSNTWFEFGINDFCNLKLEIIDKIFSEELLNSYIGSMRILDNGTLMVQLSKNEEEKDES